MAALPFGIGPFELLLVAGVVLLLFGPKRLPQLGKSLGKTVKAIREGVDGDEEGDDAKATSTDASDSDSEE
jgi:sec-independent protein translocase protein TatA